MPVSPPPPVPRTHAGLAPRASAHWRIWSWSVVICDPACEREPLLLPARRARGEPGREVDDRAFGLLLDDRAPLLDDVLFAERLEDAERPLDADDRDPARLADEPERDLEPERLFDLALAIEPPLS